MSDAPDKDSKTEEASEKKIRDAMEKGNVPVSREVAVFAAIAAMLVICLFLIEARTLRLVQMLSQLLDNSTGWTMATGGDASAFCVALMLECASFLWPFVLLFTGLGLVSSFVQGMPQLIGTRIQPDLSRLSALKGWSRLFGAKGAAEFLKVVLKFVCVTIVVFILLRSERDAVIDQIFGQPADIPQRLLMIVTRLLIAMCLIAGVVAAIDLVIVRFNWKRDLRMSKQEQKDEHKQSEGDPAVKARFRSIALDRSRRRMIAAVPKATVVIANPTHYAIALRYVRSEGGAPLVVAKGQDLIALKIREIAEANGIPVIEDKALARSMYDYVEVDTHIPAAFYRAVAELIHFLQSRQSQWRGTSHLPNVQPEPAIHDRAHSES